MTNKELRRKAVEVGTPILVRAIRGWLGKAVPFNGVQLTTALVHAIAPIYEAEIVRLRVEVEEVRTERESSQEKAAMDLLRTPLE